MLLMTALALAVGMSAVAQNVNIPDPVFKNYLINNPEINTNGDDEIQESEAAAFTGTIYYNGSSTPINDLTGIEAFTALTRLKVPHNYLSELDLSANTALTYLNCSRSPVEYIDYGGSSSNGLSCTFLNVSNCAVLDTLICSGNSLTSLDLSANTALVYLDCSDNASFTDVFNMAEQIGTQDTEYHSYDPHLASINLNGLTSLTYLNCSGNRLQTLDVSTNAALIHLDCSGNYSTYELNDNDGYTYSETPYLMALNMKNGNNTLLSFFDAKENNYLGCIEVDDAVYAQSNWSGNVDATASFSEDDCPANEEITVSVATQDNVPAEITVNQGTLPMTAIVTPDIFAQQVSWSIVLVTGDAYVSQNGLVTAFANGTVYVKAVSIVNPAKRDSMLVTISNQDNTEIDDHKPSVNNLFSLYPNPNNGRFIIEGPASGRGSYNLSISNVLGQKVYSQTEQVNGNKLRVEIAAGSLIPGMYFLEIAREGKKVAVKQFVIN